MTTAAPPTPPPWLEEVRDELRRYHVRQAIVEVVGCLVVLFVGVSLLVLGLVVHASSQRSHDDILENRAVGGRNRAVACRTLTVVDPAARAPECQPTGRPTP